MSEKKPWFIGPMLLSAGGSDDGFDFGDDIGDDTDTGGRTGQHGE